MDSRLPQFPTPAPPSRSDKVWATEVDNLDVESFVVAKNVVVMDQRPHERQLIPCQRFSAWIDELKDTSVIINYVVVDPDLYFSGRADAEIVRWVLESSIIAWRNKLVQQLRHFRISIHVVRVAVRANGAKNLLQAKWAMRVERSSNPVNVWYSTPKMLVGCHPTCGR